MIRNPANRHTGPSQCGLRPRVLGWSSSANASHCAHRLRVAGRSGSALACRLGHRVGVLRRPGLLRLCNFAVPRSAVLVFGLALPAVFLSWSSCTLAAFDGYAVDSRAAGMGNCWSVSRFSPFSTAPVPPPRMEFALSLTYRRPFDVEELAERNALVNLPLPGGGSGSRRYLVSIGLTEKGGTLYRERIYSAAASGQPHNSLLMLASVSVSEFYVTGTGTTRYVSASLGARATPVNPLEVCLGLGNFISSGLDGALPSTLLLGCGLEPLPGLRIATEARRSPGGGSSFHLGSELELADGLLIRCGLRTEPLELTMGFGFGLGALFLDTASSFHAVLGRTDSFSAGYSENY